LKFNKQDMPKVVVLGVVLTVILLTLAVQVASFNAGVSPTSTTPDDGYPAPVAVAETKDPSGFESILAPAGPTDPNTNPFREVFASKTPPIAEPQASNKEIIGELPGPLDPVRPIMPAPSQSIPTPPRLTGILTGDHPVAVFLIDGTSHTAEPGDHLPNGYVVVSISDGEAIVAYGARKVRLHIGE
jgi:hypothetical protein